MKSEKQPEKQASNKTAGENAMRAVKMTKVLLSAGGKDKELEKSKKLLEMLSGMKVQITSSNKRIPAFEVRPGLEVGVRVTIRGRKAIEMLGRLLGAIDNTLKKKQIAQNHFSFGIKEYIEIPGTEYQRDIGIKGLNVTVDFARAGQRVALRKIKMSRVPAKQHISKEEIIKFMEDTFKTKFV
jgi:large subunit ribosomal protein L5